MNSNFEQAKKFLQRAADASNQDEKEAHLNMAAGLLQKVIEELQDKL